MNMENIILAYNKLERICCSVAERYSIEENCPIDECYFIKTYGELHSLIIDTGSVYLPKEVRDFVDVIAIDGSGVPESRSLSDFLKLVVEKGKSVPDEYEELKKIAALAEEVLECENIDEFLEKKDEEFLFPALLIKYINHKEKGLLYSNRYAKVKRLEEFLEALSYHSVSLPEEFCRADCLKMVDVVKDFYNECLEHNNYADFTTFFAIYCNYYIKVGLYHQLKWSDEYLFGVPKSLFQNADARLLPYIEKIYQGILAIYHSYNWVDYRLFGRVIRITGMLANDKYHDVKVLWNDIIEHSSTFSDEFKLFQSASELWSELPIANYYCFIRTTKLYFDFLNNKEDVLSGLEEDIKFSEEEIFDMEHEPKERRQGDYNEKLNYWKQKLDENRAKYNELLSAISEIAPKKEKKYIEMMLKYFELLPENYQERVVHGVHFMLPALNFIENGPWRIINFDNKNSEFENIKGFFSYEERFRLGMEVYVRYPDKFMEILLSDKKQLQQTNKALQKAQEDRAKVINEFSHTYKNMRATSLLEVANALMATGDEDLIQHGRTVLLEYGVKQTLTKDVEMLQLRFEDKIEKLQNKIRQSMCFAKEQDSKTLRQLLSDAFKRCLIATVHDPNKKLNPMRDGLRGGKLLLSVICKRFEKEILFQPDGDVFAWFSSEIIPVTCSVSPVWESLHFQTDNYAALMVTDLIAELTANMFKYADKSKEISYEFAENKDRLFIIIKNYAAQNVEKSSDGGVGLISKRETLKLLNEAGNLNEEAITTQANEDGTFVTTVVLSKQVLSYLPKPEN